METFISPESSLIAEACYYHGEQVLEVTLRPKRVNDTEKTYIYGGFPEKEWEEFAHAKSKGAFFQSQIRPRYTGRLKE